MKIVLSFLLTLALLLGCGACAYLSKPDDDVIRAAVEKLLPDAYTATYIIYGPGIEIDPAQVIDENWTVAHYIRVAEDYPYKTIADIKKLTKKVFSANYAEVMFEYAFTNTDEYLSRYTEYGGILAMDVVTKEPFDMVKEFHLDTLHVISGNSYACKAEVEATLATDERKPVILQLVMENDKWVFDGPAY